MREIEIRTDLAVEAKEMMEEDAEKKGVSVAENFDEKSGIRVTAVRIRSKEGARAIGKPRGTYITLEAESLEKADRDGHRRVSEKLSEELRKLIGTVTKKKRTEELSVLVVGLGNRAVTSDSLGPRSVDELWITRHLENASPRISGIIPGVMAQTGMESAQIVRAIVAETAPELVIVIDALAARSVSRLGTTVQLTDTGIHPGSGVGNHRHSLTGESLGVPVIAIGVPTVVGAAAMLYDTVQALCDSFRKSGEMRRAVEWMDRQSPEERYRMIRDLVNPCFGPMMVTPKDIDERIAELSHTVAEGINMALLGAEDGPLS